MELVINRDIENKIKYLCKKIDKVEWSGLVLYTMNGNISDTDNVSFVIKDIIPMNVGSACYTEYKIHTDTSDKHIDYCMKHPEALNWKIGGLHSHCSMDSFFSSTDIKELEENAKRHYLYLSIVVNNNNKIIAKVVQAVYGEKMIKRFITNELGKKEQLNDVIEEINDIREWDLKVVFEESTVDDEFAEAVESIILEKEEKEKQALYKKLKNTYQPNLFDHYYPKNSFEEDIIKENSIEEKIDNILCELFGSFDDDFYNLLDGFSKDNTKNSKSLSKVFSNNYKRVIWKYKLLLNCGEEDLKDIVFDTLWEYKADYEFLEDIINNFYELTNDRTK